MSKFIFFTIFIYIKIYMTLNESHTILFHEP